MTYDQIANAILSGQPHLYGDPYTLDTLVRQKLQEFQAAPAPAPTPAPAAPKTLEQVAQAVMSAQPVGQDAASMEGVIADAWENEQGRQRATHRTYQDVLDGYNRGIYSVTDIANMANDGTLSSLPGFSQSHFDSVLGPAIAQGQAAQDSNFADLGMLSVLAAPLAAASAPAISAAAGGGLTGAVTAGGTIGAVGGGLTSGIQGENILEGALTGGALGAAGGGLSHYLGVGQGGLSTTDLLSAGDGSLPAFDAGGPGATLMPPATPAADPTFGGVLTQTAPGAFENLGNIEAFGSSVPQALPGTPAAAPGSVDILSSPSSPVSPSEIGFEGLPQAAATTGAATAATSGGSSGSGGGSGGGAMAGTSLARILDGTATAADWLSIGGNLAGAGLGYAAADRASERLDALARDYMALGAPSRARYEASFDPNFDINTLPGLTESIDASTDALMRKLSVHGNPYGNPGGLMEAQKYIVGNVALPAVNEYRRLNAGAGGLAQLTSAAPGAAAGAINADSGRFDAVGGAIADITNTRRSLADLMRDMRSLV